MAGTTLLAQPCPMQLLHCDLKSAARRPLDYSRRDVTIAPVRHRAPRPGSLESEPYPCVIGVAWRAAIMPHIKSTTLGQERKPGERLRPKMAYDQLDSSTYYDDGENLSLSF